MTSSADLPRRTLLTLAAAAGGGALLAACSSPSATHPTATAGTSATGTGAATAAAATVSAPKPASVPLAGGTTVTLTGTGLAAVTAVTVGGVAASDVKADATSVSFTAPHAKNFAVGDGAVALADASGDVVADGRTLAFAVVTGVDAQLQYAFEHWRAKDYNTAVYGDFNAAGGDCANFVCQTLTARGWAMTADWYNKDAGAEHTTNWTYVPAMDPWMTENASTLGATRLSLKQRDQVKVGDVVIFDWNLNGEGDHTMIVSKIVPGAGTGGANAIKLVGHNLDYDFRDFDDTITKDHPGATAWFHSIAA